MEQFIRSFVFRDQFKSATQQVFVSVQTRRYIAERTGELGPLVNKTTKELGWAQREVRPFVFGALKSLQG